MIGNTFINNGFFGNPTNGDFALTNFEPGPTDCFSGNVEQGGGPVTTHPVERRADVPDVQRADGRSERLMQAGQFTNEVLCDSEVSLSRRLPSLRACRPTTIRGGSRS